MDRQKAIVRTLSNKSKSYFSDRKKFPGVPRTIQDCNKMMGIDSDLITQVKSISDYVRTGKIPAFRLTLPPYSHVASKTAIMKKKCCNCPGDPVPASAKNRVRSILEVFLRNWIKKAEQWLAYPDDQKVRSIKKSNIIVNKIRTKRAF